MLYKFRFRESFIKAGVVHRRDHFISCINQACEGGLTCSFVDKEVMQYWQHKKRVTASVLQKKAVALVGMQDDGKTWVLSKDMHIDGPIGSLISPSDSSYAWLSHLCRGRGIASTGDALSVPLPLSTDGLLPLIEALTVILKQNFAAGLMVLGSGCMILHYKTIMVVNGECPAIFICGPVGTGKISCAPCGSCCNCFPQKSLVFQRYTREVQSNLDYPCSRLSELSG